MKHKSKTFFQKTGTQRRKQYIYIKNKISKRPERLFYTDHLLENDAYEPDEYNPTYNPHEYKSWWCDLYFLSKKNGIFYNACFITKDMAAHDAVEEYIRTEAEKRNTIPRPKDGDWFTFDPIPGSKNTLFGRNKNHTDYFNELDRLENVIKEEVLSSHTITINTDTRMDFKYRSGIGLYATLDTDDLTIEAMNNWIDNFWKNGERISKGKEIVYSGESLHNLYNRELYKRQP